MRNQAIGRLLAVGILAGLAGGLAEVAWIVFYAAVSGSDGALVARGITDTLRLATPAPVGAGIAIHMTLAALLGLAVAVALKPLRARLDALSFDAIVVSVLGLVWAVNFFVVLPAINPAFVGIVPLAVSLVSKLVFGVAAASSFRIAAGAAHAPAAVAAR